MDVTRDTFRTALPRIIAAIEEADFVAIDTELTGLWATRDERPRKEDSLQTIYEKLRRSSQSYLIVQFGLCCFKWDPEQGNLVARPYNFYIFPTTTTGSRQVDRTFSIQASAFDFLAKSAFDFNKWVYSGISYLTVAEEEAERAKVLSSFKGEQRPRVLDDRAKAFVQQMRETIAEWQNQAEVAYCNIVTRNTFQRLLVYEEIRDRPSSGLYAEGRSGFVQITRAEEDTLKTKEAERKEMTELKITEATGFRQVIAALSRSKKLVVGHNMFLDLCQIYSQFEAPLPTNVQEFLAELNRMFPFIVDTKHLFSISANLQNETDRTSLTGMHDALNQRPFVDSPRVVLHWDHMRYFDGSAHEAGYDAYLTGTSYARLAAYLARRKKDPEYGDDMADILTGKRTYFGTTDITVAGEPSNDEENTMEDELDYDNDDEDEDDRSMYNEETAEPELQLLENPVPDLTHHTCAVGHVVNWAYFVQTPINVVPGIEATFS